MKLTSIKLPIYVVLLLVVILSISLIYVYKIKFYFVGGDSMYPAIPKNSLIVVYKKRSHYLVGEVVTYYYQGSPSIVVTHRITKVIENGKLFTSQGDNSENSDPYPVVGKDIVGKVIFHIPNFDILYNAWVIGLLFYLPSGYIFGFKVSTIVSQLQKQ